VGRGTGGWCYRPTSAPRCGESCVVLHRAQMRARATIDSAEAGVLGEGEGEDVTLDRVIATAAVRIMLD
jgi:hypothetical protein